MGIGNGSGKVVEHLPHYLKVKGSSPSAADGAGREKMAMKMCKWGWAAAVAKWQNTYVTIKRSRVQVHLLLMVLGGGKWQ